MYVSLSFQFKFADDTKLEGMGDRPQGHAAIEGPIEKI